MRRFFQIHENGASIDGKKYGSFEGLCLEWSHAPNNREVVEVDHAGNVLYRFSPEECWNVVGRFRSPRYSTTTIRRGPQRSSRATTLSIVPLDRARQRRGQAQYADIQANGCWGILGVS